MRGVALFYAISCSLACVAVAHLSDPSYHEYLALQRRQDDLLKCRSSLQARHEPRLARIFAKRELVLADSQGVRLSPPTFPPSVCSSYIESLLVACSLHALHDIFSDLAHDSPRTTDMSVSSCMNDDELL